MIDDSFYLKVAHALSGCRLVEQDLKLYITEVFDLARKRIGSVLPFKLSDENSSLEVLLKIFDGQ